MNDSQTSIAIIKDYIFNNQNEDICDHCLRPWTKGICTCNKYNPRTKMIEEIAKKLLINDMKSLNEI